MYFGFLPPEINSARMYAGPGSAPMLSAAQAWDGLAGQLHATAQAYSSVIAGLTTRWLGPSSISMASAVAPYLAWIRGMAAQAEQTAAQASAAAAAYETAFAAAVPPAVVAANRSELASLAASNIFGQNSVAIAANEAQYSRMWAQDATAMSTYAAQSAAATTLTPFPAPAATTNPLGVLAQARAVAPTGLSSVAASVQSQLFQPFAEVPAALQSLATVATEPQPLSSLLTALQDIAGLQSLDTLAADLEFVPKLILPANDVLINTIMGLVIGTKHLDGLAEAGVAAAGAGSGGHLLGSTGAGGAATANVGHAGLVGAMSVPPSWATATPAIRTVASVLSGSAEGAIQADAVSQGTLLSGMAAAGMAGTALGAAAPKALGGTSSRFRSTSLKNGAPKQGESPENLQRLVAEMAEQPDNVQHWHTDTAGLESLVEKLKKKPGIHAVHLTDEGPSLTLPSPTGNPDRPSRFQ
jgi:PPE-repeat protein